MERKKTVLQTYAMVVKVVAIIAFMISLASLISAIIDRNNPLYAGYSNVDLSSYEKYKLDVLKSVKDDDTYIPADSTITKMYEAARTEKINKVNFESYRSIMVSTVVILISIILFLTHWFISRSHPELQLET